MGFFDSFLNQRYGLSGHNLKSKVDEAITLFEAGNITALQHQLYEIYCGMNKPGGGHQIIEFQEKDRLTEVFIMCLRYDWINDSDIREVWAENGFYCISTYLNRDAKTLQDYIAGAMNLFLLIHYGGNSLLPKLNEILTKAFMRVKMGVGREVQIFDREDFENGANWLLRQFSFFSATWLSKVERQYPQIISSEIRSDYNVAKNDFVFAKVSPDRILAKMQFIGDVIGSILEDM